MSGAFEGCVFRAQDFVRRPADSVQFFQIILFWLLLRQVQNLGFELEILHVQHYFYLTLNEQTRIAPLSTQVCPFDLNPVIWPVDLYVEFSIQNGPLSFPRLLVFLSHRQINELVINPESFYFWEWRFFGRERKREIGFTLGQWEERRPAFEKEKIKMFQDREKHEFMTSDYWTF